LIAGIGEGGLGGAEKVREEDGSGCERGRSWIVGGGGKEGTCQGV